MLRYDAELDDFRMRGKVQRAGTLGVERFTVQVR